jgi:hypothetical protein
MQQLQQVCGHAGWPPHFVAQRGQANLFTRLHELGHFVQPRTLRFCGSHNDRACRALLPDHPVGTSSAVPTPGKNRVSSAKRTINLRGSCRSRADGCARPISAADLRPSAGLAYETGAGNVRENHITGKLNHESTPLLPFNFVYIMDVLTASFTSLVTPVLLQYHGTRVRTRVPLVRVPWYTCTYTCTPE